MEINTVTLYTHKLYETKNFYVKTLEFKLVSESEKEFKISVGSSEILFKESKGNRNPFYHFAFDIPPNKFNEAKEWVRERVSLTIENGNDEVFFEHFPANAFYFEDPSGNIVEFISRPSITEDSILPFSANSILYISEMSLVIEKPKSTFLRLNEIDIHERDHKGVNEAGLTFMGERDSGVFLLLVPPGRKWLFSTKYSEVHPIEIVVGNHKIVINDKEELIISKRV